MINNIYVTPNNKYFDSGLGIIYFVDFTTNENSDQNAEHG